MSSIAPVAALTLASLVCTACAELERSDRAAGERLGIVDTSLGDCAAYGEDNREVAEIDAR